MGAVTDFPSLTSAIKVDIEACMPQFIFYDKKAGDYYCTNCHNLYRNDRLCRTWQPGWGGKYFQHKGTASCLCCGRECETRSMGMGRKSYHYKGFFLVAFSMPDGSLKFRAFTCVQEFGDDTTLEPDYYYREEYRYHFKRNGESWQMAPLYNGNWVVRSTVREPSFCVTALQRTSEYTLVNDDCLYDSDFRYFFTGLSDAPTKKIINYLSLCCKHPNVEFLAKGGFYDIVKEITAGIATGIRINWKANSPQKMLGLDTDEVKLLMGCSSSRISNYIRLKKRIGKKDALQHMDFVYKNRMQLKAVFDLIPNFEPVKIIKYCKKHVASIEAYNRYIRNCLFVSNAIVDDVVAFPGKFENAQERMKEAAELKKAEDSKKIFEESRNARMFLEYKSETTGLEVLLPASAEEIIKEGQVLHHCVAGYVKRHTNAETNILFVRKLVEPDKPFYTIEVNNAGNIVQCRGFKNNRLTPKEQSVLDFEKEYKQYLQEQFRRVS